MKMKRNRKEKKMWSKYIMRKVGSSARRSYALRRKYSPCRGLMTAKCRNRSGCKMALGKKRSFCRRTRSSRTRRSGRGKSRRSRK